MAGISTLLPRSLEVAPTGHQFTDDRGQGRKANDEVKDYPHQGKIDVGAGSTNIDQQDGCPQLQEWDPARNETHNHAGQDHLDPALDSKPELDHWEAYLEWREAYVAKLEADVAEREAAVAEREAHVALREFHVNSREAFVNSAEADVESREADLESREADIACRKVHVRSREENLASREADIASREAKLVHRGLDLVKREADVASREEILVSQEAVDATSQEGLAPAKVESFATRLENLIARKYSTVKKDLLRWLLKLRKRRMRNTLQAQSQRISDLEPLLPLAEEHRMEVSRSTLHRTSEVVSSGSTGIFTESRHVTLNANTINLVGSDLYQTTNNSNGPTGQLNDQGSAFH
ncbi:hypothetical protein GYMLUDRAFT_252405 [Collybiopsis luxurians FD-317 M1]|uniref:Unplaced genomic scaffold GYMLUscaffold_126, whole genome shotgun sequence n=1 Tax=Collybiopsis luxurians FD-317 M1 TaxID=944289 RepID=A0A0D0ALK5_9AGAR|nr:hypothetical protein GYMLUDRAFT_252405 [Collybiopsis luxurians FD-317 M1]